MLNNHIMDKKINKFYAKKEKEIKKIFKHNTDYSCVYDGDIVNIYDNENDLLLKAKYSIAGIYSKDRLVWYWGWNINLVNKELVKDSYHIKKSYKDITEDEYRYIAKNSNFMIEQGDINKIIKFALYMTKSIWYIPVCEDNTNRCVKDKKGIVKYLLIKEIINY